MKSKKDMLEVYNRFKTLIGGRGFIFSFGGIQEYVNGRYAVLHFGEAKAKLEDQWELTRLVDEDVLTVMYELYANAVKILEDLKNN